MDMVPQKTPDSTHDFLTDPIDAYVERRLGRGGWDDPGRGRRHRCCDRHGGLAVEDTSARPHRSAVYRERRGWDDGALGLQPGLLQGSILINLDWEDEGVFTIGSAGGDYINVDTTYAEVATPAGCNGVHSDRQWAAGRPFRHGYQQGPGTCDQAAGPAVEPGRRAIRLAAGEDRGRNRRQRHPHVASAFVVVPNDQVDAFLAYVQQYEGIVQSELAAVEPDLKVQATRPACRRRLWTRPHSACCSTRCMARRRA